MTELVLLNIFLGVAFVLAPVMTQQFFLNDSKLYSDAHKLALLNVAAGAVLNLNTLVLAWPLFCGLGFVLYLKREGKNIFSVTGTAGCIPFIFSLISSIWFVAGVKDLQLLGYNKTWSFYAALHGAFLGWFFIGCLAFLARRKNSSKIFLWGSYLCFILFLFVAFGIDGVPFIKRIGVVGFSVIVPFLIGLYTWRLKKPNNISLCLAILSLGSIVVSMTLAIFHEFWAGVPRMAFGIPLMVLIHGFLNAVFAVPCFFLAIYFERDEI